MSEKNGKVLIVDDNQDVLLSLSILLKPHMEAVRAINTPNRIDEFLDSFQPDVILLDMNFTDDAVSGEEGYTWLKHILKRDPQAVVLFITAYVNTEKAVRAIKAGAIDFIPKPWDSKKMLDTVRSAIELRKSRTEIPTLSSETKKPNTKEPSTKADDINSTNSPTANGEGKDEVTMIGECAAMMELRKQIAQVAPSETDVLILGENGTGKDVAAHMIHAQSKRRNQPFVTIDLGAKSETLFESELFGHEKGAFTDAKAAKEGLVETANGGTLFLDEIGNLSLAMQQKLLTLLEKKELVRLGSTKTKKVDIRVIAATNADLSQMVAEGTFRRDLYYRLNTIELHMPPLRKRGNDILLLAEHFVKLIGKKEGKKHVMLTDNARKCLLNHAWPGNVRELIHVLKRAIVFSTTDWLTSADFQLDETEENVQKPEKETLNLAELEQQAIMKAIERADGNLSMAAEMLGITRFKLYRKIEKLNNVLQ